MINKVSASHTSLFRVLSDWIKYGLTCLRRTLLPAGLLYRFMLIILVPLLFLQAVVMVVFFDRHWDTISRRLAMDVVGEIKTVADVIDSGDVPVDQIALLVQAMNDNLGFQIRFEPGGFLSDGGVLPPEGPVQALVTKLNDLPYPFTLSAAENQKMALDIQLSTGVLHAQIARKRFFSTTVYVFLVWMIGFAILLFWIAFLFMKNQVRAIERLSRAAELFGRGQSLESFKPEGATEVRRAGQSFIQMRNRIQRYLTERTGMLSGVSHDLRTPLTRMKLQLSMTPASEMVQDLLGDVTEMEHMLEAYLSFARGEGKEQPETVCLNTLVADAVAKLVRTGQQIDLHQEGPVFCACRPNDMTRAITNLLTNAGRYAHRAQATIGTYHHMARLVIDDDGPGIPPDKRADVFRAFYRMESSRNTHTGGIGLGLTITRDIILSHGGEIALADSPLGGLRVTVLLPSVAAPKHNTEIKEFN